jgi:hypothetical protein
MPLYSYECNKNTGGCGHQFQLVSSMDNYNPSPPCSFCKRTEFVCRDLLADLPTTNVKKSDNEITLGHLADRNTERMSEEHKQELTKKHNAYKYEEPTKILPKGMTRLRDTENPGTCKISNKQSRKRPINKRKK